MQRRSRIAAYLPYGFAAAALAAVVLLPVYLGVGFLTGVFGICSTASPWFGAFYGDVVPWLFGVIALLIGWRVMRSNMEKEVREKAREELKADFAARREGTATPSESITKDEN